MDVVKESNALLEALKGIRETRPQHEWPTWFDMAHGLVVDFAIRMRADAVTASDGTLRRMRDRLTAAASQFRTYAEHHVDKGDITKAETNHRWELECLRAAGIPVTEWPRPKRPDETSKDATPTGSFQERTNGWITDTFNESIAMNKEERNLRFVEEALELAQACGCPREDVLALADHVYSRPFGMPAQEAGGTLVCLAQLCTAHGIDMLDAGEVELKRCEGRGDQILGKWLAKTIRTGRPRPTCAAPAPIPASTGAVDAASSAVRYDRDRDLVLRTLARAAHVRNYDSGGKEYWEAVARLWGVEPTVPLAPSPALAAEDARPLPPDTWKRLSDYPAPTLPPRNAMRNAPVEIAFRRVQGDIGYDVMDESDAMPDNAVAWRRVPSGYVPSRGRPPLPDWLLKPSDRGVDWLSPEQYVTVPGKMAEIAFVDAEGHDRYVVWRRDHPIHSSAVAWRPVRDWIVRQRPPLPDWATGKAADSPKPADDELSDLERGTLRSALGLRLKDKPFRRHCMASPGGQRLELCERLVERELMRPDGETRHGLRIFRVTEKGAAVVGHELP